MSLSREDVAARVLASLGPAERPASAVYLGRRELAAGSTITIDRAEVQVPWDALLAFVDLQPTANWGHPCRYLLVARDSGEIRAIAAAFPPFRSGTKSAFELLWRGEAVPDWAIAGH